MNYKKEIKKILQLKNTTKKEILKKLKILSGGSPNSKGQNVKFNRFEISNLVSPRKEINKEFTYSDKEYSEMRNEYKNEKYNSSLMEYLESLPFYDLIKIAEKVKWNFSKNKNFSKEILIQELFSVLKK